MDLKIVDILNVENIITPSYYQYQKLDKPNPHNISHLWGNINVKLILNNQIYLGTLAQMKGTMDSALIKFFQCSLSVW